MEARLFVVVAVLALLAGCGSSPERNLQKGYQTVSASAKSATVLVNRGQISADDAQRVEDYGRTLKQTLDAGQARLKACRAENPIGKCTAAVSGIELGAGVAEQLEKYLEANQ